MTFGWVIGFLTDLVAGLPSTGTPGLSLYLSTSSAIFNDFALSKSVAVRGRDSWHNAEMGKMNKMANIKYAIVLQ